MKKCQHAVTSTAGTKKYWVRELVVILPRSVCASSFTYIFFYAVYTLDFKKHVSTRVNPAGLNYFNWKISNKTGVKVPCFPIRYLKKKPAFPVPKKVIFHSQDDKANYFQLIKHPQINKQHH